MIPMLVRVLVLGGLLLIVWYAVRPNYTIRIHAGSEGVVNSHGLTERQRLDVDRFLISDVLLDTDITILAGPDFGGRVKVRVRGQVDRGTRQQIRNFFNSEFV